MTEPRSIGLAGASGREPTPKRTLGSISYDRDQLLSLSASPLAAASIPDPGRLANFAPIFASSTPSDNADEMETASISQGISAVQLNAAETPMLRPVAGKAIFRQITSLVELDPSLMKPVTPEELELRPEMEQAVATVDAKPEGDSRVGEKSMHVDVDAEDQQDRRGSLRPGANAFVPGVPSGKPTSDGFKDNASALAKPIHALPERPTLCAMQPNLPRWALSPSNAALGSIALDYAKSPPNGIGIGIGMGSVLQSQDDRRGSSVLMNEVSSWRSGGVPVRDRMMSTGLVGQGHLQTAEDRRASQSMTPWARRKSIAETGSQLAGNTTASRSIAGGLNPSATGSTPFAAFSFGGSKDNSFVDASPRKFPLAGGAGGFSPEARVPGSVSSSAMYMMGSLGAGGAVKVPKRPSMGDVLAEETTLLGAVPMQGPGAYK